MPRLCEARLGKEGHRLPHERRCSDIVRKNIYLHGLKFTQTPEAVLGSGFLDENDGPHSSRETQQFLYLG